MTLTLPPHTLAKWNRDKKATIVLPMEPQLVGVETDSDGTYYIVPAIPGRKFCQHQTHYLIDALIARFALHHVGDVLKIFGPPKLTDVPETIGRGAGKATVTSVDAKRVRSITADDAIQMGLPDDQRAIEWVHNTWIQQHPAHPFDKAWAWLIGVEA